MYAVFSGPKKKTKKPVLNVEKSHEEQVEERLQLTLKAAKEHQTLLHQLNLPEINIATLPSYTRKSGKAEDDKVHHVMSNYHNILQADLIFCVVIG